MAVEISIPLVPMWNPFFNFIIFFVSVFTYSISFSRGFLNDTYEGGTYGGYYKTS